jgi:colanic acid biosynthesis protein WcaH
MIPAAQFKQILEVMPVLCVDVVLRNSRGEYLLVKRANEPLKGQWWVVGGRVFKDETLEQAVRRKVKQEVGLTVQDLEPIGYYEDWFEKNAIPLDSRLHAVSVVFAATIDAGQVINTDGQSLEWGFFPELPPTFAVKPFGGGAFGSPAAQEG